LRQESVAGLHATGHNLFGVAPTGMHVVCAQCHAIVVVEDVASANLGVDTPCVRCGAPIDLHAAVPESGEMAWLIQTAEGQAGPCSALHMALLFDSGNADWGSPIWRPGLKGWRAARRDPELVTALASVRGGGGSQDTQRVAGHLSLLAEPLVAVREREQVELALAGEGSGLTLASESSGLALASGSVRIGGRPRAEAEDVRYFEPGRAEPTFADVLRSAPSVLTALPTLEPAPTRRAPLRRGWLPSTRSMLLVAVLAFASGVLAAAFGGRILERRPARASTIVFAAPPRAAQPHAAAQAVAPATTSAEPGREVAEPGAQLPPLASAAEQAAEASSARELPAPAELARALRRVAPEVRRCLGAPARTVEVEVLFEGASGQVGGINLHTSRLRPGEVECITHALRQLRVSAFRSPQHKLAHRFAF
jgi:hypothetical protein